MAEEKNYFLVEGVAKEDWIGFDSYLYSLDSAINSGAKFIGLIADYGSGKSTLINMLKNSQKLKNNELIKINLWNCYTSNEDNKIDIHRIFLHELIDKLEIGNKNYYKKKIDKNYNIFDIKLKNNNPIFAIILFFYYLLCILEKLGFISLFISELNLVGYSLIAILTLLCVIYYKPVMAYKKAENNSRVIDENDTKDLYNEIIGEYHKKNKDVKNLIICLEELDRYDKSDTILEYLKEFYKFYKEPISKQNVIFIVSLKSANQLNKIHDKQQIKDNIKIKNIYEKLFDFIVNLNQISIHDYDSIIYSIINTKQTQIPEGIKIPSNKNLKNWRYLYKGKHIRIRDIKHRYNFAISLYLSVNESGIKADFDKCLFISYLEDEYNELYEKLINENLINSLLINYANGNRDFKELGIKDDDNDVLLEGLDSKYISIDYNYYFYKFPKNKKSYNIYEYELYNAIFYDTNSKNLNLSLKKLDEIQIYDILSKRVNQSFLPKVVFNYPKLLMIAYNKEYTAFCNTLEKNFNLLTNFDQFHNLMNDLKKLNKKEYKTLLNEYFKYYLPMIKELDKEKIFNLRKKIVEELGNESLIISDIFMGENYLICGEEISCIKNFQVVIKLTNFKIINDDCLNNYINILKKQKISKNLIIQLLVILSNNSNITIEMYNKFFYSINLNKYNFRNNEYLKIFEISKIKLDLNNVGNYNKFLNYINYYCEKFDDFYLKNLKITDLETTIVPYKNYLNKCGKIYDAGMKFLNDYSIKYSFSKNIREQFYKNGYYQYYIISTMLDDEIYEIEDDKFSNLAELYVIEYEQQKNWKYKVGNNMKQYLYKSVNMNILDEARLILFNDLPQRTDIIKAVLNTNNPKFINKYLSSIVKINNNEIFEVFKLIGIYNRNEGLKKSAKDNLKTLTKNKKYLQQLDARRKLLEIV